MAVEPAKKLQLAVQPLAIDGGGIGRDHAKQLRGAGYNHRGSQRDGGRLGANRGQRESQQAKEREWSLDCPEKWRKSHLLQHTCSIKSLSKNYSLKGTGFSPYIDSRF